MMERAFTEKRDEVFSTGILQETFAVFNGCIVGCEIDCEGCVFYRCAFLDHYHAFEFAGNALVKCSFADDYKNPESVVDALPYAEVIAARLGKRALSRPIGTEFYDPSMISSHQDKSIENALIRSISCQFMRDKVKKNHDYACKLYSSLCNHDFYWIDQMDSMDNAQSFSWRYAGGLVASMIHGEDDYMEFYCNGHEGCMFEEVFVDLLRVGIVGFR